MITRCDKCFGQKFIVGMGGMKLDCDKCEKTGYMSSDKNRDSGAISSSEIDQLRIDLQQAIAAYKSISADNKKLKELLENYKNNENEIDNFPEKKNKNKNKKNNKGK